MFFFLGPWWTVDGGQLLGEEEYKREEDEFRLDNIREVVKKSKWKFKMAFAIRGPTPPPPLMAQISRHFFTPLFFFCN